MQYLNKAHSVQCAICDLYYIKILNEKVLSDMDKIFLTKQLDTDFRTVLQG